ncbi:glucokinase [Marinimicrobium sp. ABcell2]|uniref:glucokinase n=1 Tax=Marinimicrobium sp. ABcell2 TaxID=3069751 RepID=UPI0027B85433|nr:glucokinase [Marinimicrobium sp. ABcell2]MDQ2077331.1 glucokinase [Marinimicrobium sp. ABcell2]
MSSILVADIGGTNARFGLVDIAGTKQPNPDYTAQSQITLRCANYPTIAQMIRAYGEEIGTPLPAFACLAIAGPIQKGRVRMTNLQWEFGIAELQKELGMDALDVINDFAALAYAMPHLTGTELHQFHAAEADPEAPKLALGPGTGFGMAGLVPCAGRWKIVATEGGHTNFAPGTLEEVEILKYLLERQPHVSVENLISGNGLVTLYKALAGVSGQKAEDYSPADVNQHGQAGTDPLCRSALDTFCGILGSVAGDKALSTGARGGVYVGGGIVPRLVNYIPQTTFLQRYTNKGPMTGYVQGIPLNAIIKDTAALVGTAAWLLDTVPALAD